MKALWTFSSSSCHLPSSIIVIVIFIRECLPPTTSNMWWKQLLFVAVLVTLAQGQSNERDNEKTLLDQLTMGKSGPVCTPQGRRCILNATCTDQSCQCLAGQKGPAEIECVDRGELLCYFAGDPHVTAFGGAKAAISLPCRFRASRFVTAYAASRYGGACSFEVWATNTLHDGRYAIRSVHISVAISDPVLQIHTAAEIYKSGSVTFQNEGFNVSDDLIYNYQARVHHRDNIWGSSGHQNLNGINMFPDFDDENNFATLSIPDCGTRIKYRAFDPRRDKHQKQLPGVTIMTDKGTFFPPSFGDYPPSVCGVPSDGRNLYKNRAEDLGLVNDDTAVLFDILNQRPVQLDNNQFKARCERSFDLFGSSADQVSDLNGCGFLLTKATVGRCIEADNRQPIDIFNACLEHKQGGNRWCGSFRRIANLCGSEPDWAGPAASAIVCGKSAEETTESPEEE